MRRTKKSAKPQTLAELEAQEKALRDQLDALQAQRQEVEAHEVAQMAEIVGRVYVAQAREDEAKWTQLQADMNAALKKKDERALFGLPPRPRKPRRKKGDVDQGDQAA